MGRGFSNNEGCGCGSILLVILLIRLVEKLGLGGIVTVCVVGYVIYVVLRWLGVVGDSSRDGRSGGETQSGDSSGSQSDSRDETKFLYYLFAMLSKMAKADGRIGMSEVEVAESVLRRLDVAARHAEFCKNAFNTAKDDDKSIYWYASRFCEEAPKVEVRVFMYELLWDIACADGQLSQAERDILLRICSHLGVPGTFFYVNYMRRFGRAEGTSSGSGRQAGGQSGGGARRTAKPDPYSVIGCESTATDEEVTKAYRKAAKRYHPDLLRANGVPEEMVAKATKKMAEINAAWEEIKKARGL